MKIRNGFVSNSSSSSFVIAKHFMTDDQIEAFSKWCSEDHSENEDGYEYEYGVYINETSLYFFGGEIDQGFIEEISNKMRELCVDSKYYEFGD